MYIFQPDRHLLRKQIKELGRYITGRTLDIGAGERNRYGELFRATEYVTMDVRPGPNVAIVGDIERIPSPDASFDSIICTQVLEHVPHPEQAVRELYRVLRPGGHLLITVPQVAELHEEPRDYFRYTPFGIERLCAEAGFVFTEKSQRGGYFALRAQQRIRYLMDRFALYKRPFLGRISSLLFAWYGKTMIWLDARDRSTANRKHAIGWAYVFQKAQ